MSVDPSGGGGPKIALIDVDGLLLNMDMTGFYSMGENPVSLFREKLDRIARDPCVRAVVIRINSPGGGVTASDIMADDLVRFKAKTGLPVVACLMDIAAGGAYYLACGADVIVAHPTTISGGIGVILNQYNLQDLMAQFNVIGLPIKSGEFIDMGSVARPPTEEGRALLQQMADEFHARFKEAVAAKRPLTAVHAAMVFDGRVFSGRQATQYGLVDTVGYLDDAIQIAQETGGAPGARVVMFHRSNDPVRSPYSITPNVPIQSALFPLSIPGLDRSRLPTFLYLWQPDPTLEKWGGH